MTTHPASPARGACTSEIDPPAENIAISVPEKSKSSSTPTVCSRLPKRIFAPAERSLASGWNSATGKLRSSSNWIIVSPTSPVAPTTATLNCLLIFFSRMLKAPHGCALCRLKAGDCLPRQIQIPARRRRPGAGPSTPDHRRHAANVGILPTLAQIMIHDDQRQLRLRNRGRAQSDAWVVTTLGQNLYLITLNIHGSAGSRNARSRFQRNTDYQVLAGRDAAEHPARVVGQKPVGSDFVAMLRALLRYTRKTGAYFDTLDRVDIHHRVRNIGIEAIKYRLAQSGWHACRYRHHPGPD